MRPSPSRRDGAGRGRPEWIRRLLGELERPEASTLGDVRVALRHLAAPERDRAAPAGDHGDPLLAVLLPGDGRAGDAGAGVVLPQLLAGRRVVGLQGALGRAGEDQVAVGAEDAAPEDALVVRLPDDVAVLRVDRLERADVVREDR